jgi:flavin reductase (DIM6/NTAB) family NADH-FMN oxidoreductase RutF
MISCHLDAAAFRRSCSRYATGVTVTTVAAADGTPHGLTVNSFTSVSCAPPLILVCLDLRSALLEHFRTCGSFAVNVLSETQRSLSVRFATRGADRFDGIEWRLGANGAPLIDGCIGWFECRPERRIEVGDHLVVVGEVLDAAFSEGRPLIYFASQYGGLR